LEDSSPYVDSVKPPSRYRPPARRELGVKTFPELLEFSKRSERAAAEVCHELRRRQEIRRARVEAREQERRRLKEEARERKRLLREEDERAALAEHDALLARFFGDTPEHPDSD